LQHLPSLTRDIVLLGGGHAHALVLRMALMEPIKGARLTVINPGPTAPYSGMLPGHVAGHYTRDELQIDLVRLCRAAGARLVLGHATGIDRAAQVVRVSTANGEREIGYDIASVDVGVTSEMPGLEGFAEHGTPAKPLDTFADRWDSFVQAVEPGEKAPVVVIGAGVAGVELAMAARHRLIQAGAEPQVHVIDAAEALPGLGGSARARIFEELRNQQVWVVENTPVTRLIEGAVVLEGGREVPARFVIGAGGARPHDWLTETGLALESGYIKVGADLRSLTDKAIFAVGDCAHFTPDPRPKAGVYAVRAAGVLLENLRRVVAGNPKLRRFKPQSDYLKLISLGDKSAIGEKWGVALAGPRVWKLKNRIDQNFMKKFTDLPSMAEEAGGEQALCAGCGAKIAPAALKQALKALPPPERDDVLSLPGDDAAVLAMEGDWQVITTDHLRGFTEDLALMARIAAVHALGDVWAMGARPQAALATVNLPRMAPQMQARSLEEILSAASEVFRAEGAELVGGHSAMGAEVILGFTVTGLRTAYPVGLEGAKAGDALILTKPIGTGTILAGEMQGKARGAWVSGALESMAKPQGAAAKLLRSAHAMTDVTGFGLAGHLAAICEASGVGAALKLEAVPLLPGAAELATQGVRSTLWPDNRGAAAGRIILPAPLPPEAALLFDPQTAGGLLAAVSAGRASALIKELRDLGFEAARIGQVVEGEPLITLR